MIVNYRTINAKLKYRITVISSDSNGGTVTGSGYYEPDEEVTIIASTNDSYIFKGWYNSSDELVSNELEYSFLATSDETYKAVFVKIVSVTVIAFPEYGGKVYGGGQYEVGQTVTVRAVPGYVQPVEENEFVFSDGETVLEMSDGSRMFVSRLNDTGKNDEYDFDGWFDFSGKKLSSEKSYSFDASNDIVLIAKFSQVFYVTISYDERITPKPEFIGTGPYKEGEEVTITAIAPKHYKFLRWEVNGETINTNSSYTFVINENIDIEAVFEENFILNEFTWQEISDMSKSGVLKEKFKVGDTKEITLTTNFGQHQVDAFIIGFDHNQDIESPEEHTTHFQVGKVGEKIVAFVDGHYGNRVTTEEALNMNTSDTSSGGWKGSQMSRNMSYLIKKCLPSDLQSVMKTVTKYTDNKGSSSNSSTNVTSTTEYLCPPSEFEYFGIRKYANIYEQNKQKQYDYYKTASTSSMVQYNFRSIDTNVNSWTRSQVYSNSAGFVNIQNDGSIQASYASFSIGVSPIIFI